MIHEHECVVWTVPLPAGGLEAGDNGTVVHVYKDGEAHEVEFIILAGETAAVATMEAPQVRPIASGGGCVNVQPHARSPSFTSRMASSCGIPRSARRRSISAASSRSPNRSAISSY